MIEKANEAEEVEVGFVHGSFKMYKLRESIAKARAELLLDTVISSYTHIFGTFLFGNHIDYKSSLIKSLIKPRE